MNVLGLVVLMDTAIRLFNAAEKKINDVTDTDRVSLPAYTKPLRICSRVYIDGSVSSEPVVTDVIKTVHTQYAAFILAALQMNQFVTSSKTVGDLLHTVSTEDNKLHESVIDNIFSLSPANEVVVKVQPTTGEVVSFAGDNHIPAGKILEVTFASPNNPGSSVTLNIMVQLSPFIIPAQVAVQFIAKDVTATFSQRWMQWKTGEISFWKDFVFLSDVAKRREKLMKADPTGVLADDMANQAGSRLDVLKNSRSDKADRKRNIANSVLIFSSETLRRAKAESGIDLNDKFARQKYFATSFSMIIAIIDMLYDQVTFYYNGIDDGVTFSFDQMKVANKGGSGLDLVSIMNALNQGRSPKF